MSASEKAPLPISRLMAPTKPASDTAAIASILSQTFKTPSVTIEAGMPVYEIGTQTGFPEGFQPPVNMGRRKRLSEGGHSSGHGGRGKRGHDGGNPLMYEVYRKLYGKEIKKCRQMVLLMMR